MSEQQIPALLVSLKLSLCRQSRQNPTESRKVENQNHAKEGVVRVTQCYWPEDALGPLKKFFNGWRQDHAQYTRNWDEGVRLLPAALIEKYREAEARRIYVAPALKAEFINDWPDHFASAPERMGSLFDEADFPTQSELTESIQWQVNYLPLPTGEQWRRIGLLAPDLVTSMEQSTNERVQQAIQETRAETWRDLVEPVQHIIDTLSKDKPRIFDSLLGNLNKIIELVPAFNLTHDSDLNLFADACRSTLANINPDDLRESAELRKTTVQAAQNLLSQFGALGQRRFAA